MTAQYAGGGDLSSSGSPSSRVPCVFHFVWMGDDELPPEYARFMQKWGNLHPDWKVCGWDERMARKELLTTSPGLLKMFNDAEEIVSGSPWQFRSDLIRLELLYRYGGVYLDVDTEPLMSIEKLCGVGCWFAWEKQDVWVGNTYIGAPPQHPFIARLISGLPQQVGQFGGKGHRANVVSGPQYVTKQLKEYKNDDVTVYDESMFYPYSFEELHRHNEYFDGAYAVHHWNNMRNKKGLVIVP